MERVAPFIGATMLGSHDRACDAIDRVTNKNINFASAQDALQSINVNIHSNNIVV